MTDPRPSGTPGAAAPNRPFEERLTRTVLRRLALAVLWCHAHCCAALPSQQPHPTPDPPTVPVHGRVVDETGVPLADVAVLVNQQTTDHLPSAALVAPTTQTDAQGRFTVTLPNHVAGQFLLVAKGRACALVSPFRRFVDSVRLRSGGNQEPDLVVLPPGTELRGRVRDALGKPIAGAELTAWDTLADRRVDARMSLADVHYGSRARTDADGRFALFGVFAEGMAVQCSARGYLTQTLRPVDRTTPLTFELQASGECRGQVVDAQGEPVVSNVVGNFEAGEASFVATDADGRFALPLPFAGRYRVTARCHEAPGRSTSKLLHGPTADVVLTMPPPTVERLAVRAVSAADRVPIERFRAGARWLGPDSANAELALAIMQPNTDAIDGIASLTAPDASNAQSGYVLITAAGFARTVVSGLTWDPTDPELLVELAPEASVAGRVLGPDGQSIADARVTVVPQLTSPEDAWVDGWPRGAPDQRVATAADGSFRMGRLAAGTYVVRAAAADLPMTPPVEIRVASAETKTGLELRFERGATLRGKLQGFTRDCPVELSCARRMQVPEGFGWLVRGLLADPSMRRSPRIDADGTFAAVGLAPGTYDLQLTFWPHVRAALPLHIAVGSVVISKDELAEFDLRGKLPTTLRGQLTVSGATVPLTRFAAIAEVVPDGQVTSDSPAWRSGSRAPVSMTGEFALRVLPGKHRVAIVDLHTGIDLAAEREPITVPAEGARFDLAIEFGRVRVTLHSADDTPVAVHRLELRHRASTAADAAPRRTARDSDAGTGVLLAPGQKTAELTVPLGELTIVARNHAAALAGGGQTPTLGSAEIRVVRDRLGEVELEVTAPRIPDDG